VRLHRALMPDGNRKATVYWWTVVMLGAGALGHALWTLAALPLSTLVMVALGAAVAVAAGLVPVRIPPSKNILPAGEIFIFLLLLKFGPAAAVLGAAGEAAVGSWRTSRCWTSRIFSPAMAAVAMGSAGWALQFALAAMPASAGLLILAAMATALGYFVVITLLVTAVPRLKNKQPLRLSDLSGVFGWVGIAYASSAAVAALLYLVSRESGDLVLLAMVPLLTAMLWALRLFFRQQKSRAETDAHERQLAEQHMVALRASERRFHSAFTHASIGMALLAGDGRVRQVNDALRELLKLGDEALLDKPLQARVWAEDLDAFENLLRTVREGGTPDAGTELRCRDRDGGAVWVAAHCAYFIVPEPQAGGDTGEAVATTTAAPAQQPSLILQVQDITARREAEGNLQRIAFHDSLTELPNRRLFNDLLGQAVAEAQRPNGPAYAVMFLDFDRFKLINDSLGHNIGDEFLVQVARRIQAHLRPQDLVARLGGDEFAVLARPLERESCAVGLAERLMEALRQPFVVSGHEINTSASIGITFSAFGYSSAQDVLRDADTAMYKAKNAGKARYALFDTSLHTAVANRLRLEGDLRRAIDSGKLSVAYQPQYRLDSGRLYGFEALVRWQHPDDGTIGPNDFLPIAEEAGLMLKLTDFVMHCACRQLASWQRSDPALADLRISVNLSSNDLAHGALVARVTKAVVESGLEPRHLVLELNEHFLMKRLGEALPLLVELRRLGVQLAVDDFGVGEAPLSKLATLPVNILKVDGSFIQKLDHGDAAHASLAIVRAVLLLGRSLDMTVVAEGIETEAQCEQLREMGCELGQGYHLGRPLKPEQVAAMLDEAARHLPLQQAMSFGEGHSQLMRLH